MTADGRRGVCQEGCMQADGRSYFYIRVTGMSQEREKENILVECVAPTCMHDHEKNNSV